MRFTGMDRELTLFILLICTTSSIALNLPDGVKVKCPSRYRVQAMSDKVVKLQVVDNITECNKLMKAKSTKTSNKYVIPSVSTVYKEGEYKANITWEFEQTGKKLPKVFLINLTFFDIKRNTYISDTYVLLKLTGNRKVKSNGLVKFYFDCIPLLETPEVGLVVQIWSYTRPGRLCRSLRSVSQKTVSCCPDVQCSGESSFPISKNLHHYELCACHIKHQDIPKLNWHYDYSKEKFFIIFTNIPPYLQSASIEIVESQSEDRLVDEIKVTQDKVTDGEVHVESKPFSMGNYTVYVLAVLKLYLQCMEPGPYEKNYKLEVSDRCESENNYFAYRSQTLTVRNIKSKPKKSTSDEQVFFEDVKAQLILGVVAGLLVTAAVTSFTFYLCQRRKTDRTRSDFVLPFDWTEMIELSGRRMSVVDIEAINNNTPMIGEDTPKNLSATYFDRIDGKLDPHEMEHLKTCREMPNHAKGNISPNATEPDHTNETGHSAVNYGQKLNVRNNPKIIVNRAAVNLQSTKKYQLMLIDFPDADNPQHIQKVAKFCQCLSLDFGIIIERGTVGNMYNFALSAFDRYFNVVMIMSKELAKLCHHFRNAEEMFNEPFSRKNHAILPCIVLYKMKKLLDAQTSSQSDIKPLLNIVCLDSSSVTKQALRLFLNDNLFINTANTCFHAIYKNDQMSDDLIPALGTLLKSLKPSVWHDMPVDSQISIRQLNKDNESLNIEFEENL